MTSKAPRRNQDVFPFLDLPYDLQLSVLRTIDLRSLQTLTTSSNTIKAIFLDHPGSIIRGALSYMHPQLRYLLLTTHGIDFATKHPDIYPRPKFEKMSKFLKKSLDEDNGPGNAQVLCHDPVAALKNLIEIEHDVNEHVMSYAEVTYRTICKHDDIITGDDVRSNFPPLKLSVIEEHRIKRAFYRVRLYNAIFYDYSDVFKVDLRESYNSFFKRLSAFELDEWILAELHCRRRRGYHLALCGHIDCRSYGATPWRKKLKSPTWEECLKASKESETKDCLLTWRVLHQFRDILKANYMDGEMEWIDASKCRETPSRTWDDDLEANEPNSTWRSCFKQLHVDNEPIFEYGSDFQMLGFCFWDEERVRDTWGDIFGAKRRNEWWRVYYWGKNTTDEEIAAQFRDSSNAYHEFLEENEID